MTLTTVFLPIWHNTLDSKKTHSIVCRHVVAGFKLRLTAKRQMALLVCWFSSWHVAIMLEPAIRWKKMKMGWDGALWVDDIAVAWQLIANPPDVTWSFPVPAFEARTPMFKIQRSARLIGFINSNTGPLMSFLCKLLLWGAYNKSVYFRLPPRLHVAPDHEQNLGASQLSPGKLRGLVSRQNAA